MKQLSNILFRINQAFWVAVAIIWYVPKDFFYLLNISIGIPMLLIYSGVLLSSFVILVFFMIRILQYEQQCFSKIIIFGCISFFLLYITYSETYNPDELSNCCIIVILEYLLLVTLFSSTLHIILYPVAYKINTSFNAVEKIKKILDFIDTYCYYTLNNYAWLLLISIISQAIDNIKLTPVWLFVFSYINLLDADKTGSEDTQKNVSTSGFDSNLVLVNVIGQVS